MKILFMCVGNSGRSQMAEGMARHLFPEAEIWSAGSKPETLHPHSVFVMKEMGIDISKQYSKSLDQIPKDFVTNLDFVITLCADEVCPVVISNGRKIHWPYPDPETSEKIPEEKLRDRFRQFRDDIRQKLLVFKRSLSK